MMKTIRHLLITVALTVVSYFSMALAGKSSPFAEKSPERETVQTTQVADIKPQVRPETKSGKKKITISQDDVYAGLVMVKFTEEASEKVAKKTGHSGVVQTRSAGSKLRIGLSSVEEKLAPMKATRIKRVFPYHPRFEKRQNAKGLHLWYEIAIDTTLQLNEVCRQLENDANIQVVEPVLKTVILDVKGKKKKSQDNVSQTVQRIVMPLNGGMTRQLSTRASSMPFSASLRGYEDTPPVNDPLLLQQWHYYNYGQVTTPSGMASTPGADIKLFDAWRINMGDPRVIVSVHDEGVQSDHPDLAANMWINEAEKNGRTGVDDDNNGYVDDVYGYNFASNSSNIVPGDHGSHTGGTISAVNNNGIGVAGIAGGTGNGDGVRLMSCQIFQGESSAGHAASFVYAANNGAVISQNSWGHTKAGYYVQATLDAIDYFIEYAGKDEHGNPLPNTPMVGGIVIFAAGNDGKDELWYPGYYEPCLTVGALGPWYDKPSYTNFGAWVDIAAPGGSIADNGTESAGVLSCIAGGKYNFMQGTSMACPHVSGVAALILSEYGHSGYTPEMLRNRLLNSVTSWSEIGKDEYDRTLGVGMLNAAKALAPDKEIAPDAVTDLRVESIGYEFVRLAFTAPADKDNGSAASYELRYSTDSVTADSFSMGMALFQVAQEAGSLEEIIVDKLKGFTKYQIALKAVDIWGNVSEMSNVVEVTTKESPSITVSPDSIGLEIADVLNVKSEGWFEVGNTKGGDLRYSVSYAIQQEPNSNPEQFSGHIYNYDPADPNLSEGSFGSDGEERFLAATRFQVKNQKSFVLTNVVAGIHPLWEFEGMGSYTKTPFRLKIYKGGTTPFEGKLLHDAEYSVLYKDYVLLGSGADLNYQLAGAYCFEEGEHFWVVFDFEKGFFTPMKIHGSTSSLLGNELYSVNDTIWEDINTVQVGNMQPNLAYRIFALSNQNELPGNLITLEPAEGFVSAGEQQRVKVAVDARLVEEGDYSALLFISHNDPDQSVIQLPLTFSVEGHHAGISSEKTVSFGDVVQGFADTMRLTVYNDSLGVLRIDTIISDKPQFTVEPSGSLVILPGDSLALKLKFTAPGISADGSSHRDSVGMFLSKLNFKTNAGHGDYSVVMDAVSIERPIAKLNPAEETVELRMGETKEVEFTLKNEGKYRLDYQVEQDKTADFDFWDCRPNVNMYYGKREHVSRWASLNKFNAENITDHLKGMRNYIVPLPFTFNYYGVNYDTVTIASDGNIHMGGHKDYMGNPSNIGRWAIPSTIFPCYRNHKARITDVGGEVFLKTEGAKITVEYTKLGDAIAAGDAETIRIQVVLHADGKIELKYKDFKEKPRKSGLNLGGMIGMSDNTPYGGLGIWLCREYKNNPGYYVTGSTYLFGAEESMIITQGEKTDTVFFHWTPPVIEYDKNTVITITPEVVFAKEIASSEGHLLPDESVTVRVKVGTDKNLKEGRYERIIPVYTNDPENKEMGFKLIIDFKSEARPVLNLTELDFGKVGKEVTAKAIVPIRNLGGKPFKATAKMADGTFFKVTPAEQKECAGLAGLEYEIAFTPTEEKVYDDRLVIEIEEGAPLTLNVKGEGVKAPRLEVVPGDDATYQFEVDRRADGSHYVDTSVIVRNIGEAPLDYQVMTTEWIRDLTPVSRSGMDKTGYFWSDNLDDGSGVQYEWLEENPIPFDPLPRVDGMLHFSREFDLPWPFEFYGERFTKCYVNMSGMVYFNRNDIIYHPQLVNAVEAPNLIIPHEGMVNGYIAALGGSFDRSKHWYEVIGEGENARIVFTWRSRPLFDAQLAQDTNYVTFQTILYKDGGIKFQYKDVENAWWRNRTVIGIENRQGTDGVNVCSNDTKYIRNGLAVFIKPSKSKTLQPGEEKKIWLRADASELWEKNGNGRLGETVEPHKGVVLVRSNDPMKPSVQTKVEMKVRGEAKAEYVVEGERTQNVEFGELLRSMYPKSHDPEEHSYLVDEKQYTQTVTVKNTGTKSMFIHSEKTALFDQAYITDEFNYTSVYPATAQYIEIAPTQEYQLDLTIKPSYVHPVDPGKSAPEPGSYIKEYLLAQKCNLGDSIKCREAGYSHHVLLPSVFGGEKYSYSYKIDTLRLSFSIADIPLEKVTGGEEVQKIVYDSRSGSDSFTFGVKNEKITDPQFWNTMHKWKDTSREKSEIQKQADLNYRLEIEDLTRAEFEQLLEERKGNAEPESPEVSSLAVKADVVMSGNLHLVELPAAQTMAARVALKSEEPKAFIDSLGYFDYEKRIGGYSAGQGQTLTSYIRYRAGSRGFNLTHFTTGMARLDNFPQDGYEVKIKVMLGSDARTADLAYTETFVPEISVAGEFTTIEHRLERPVYIYPGQYFWIGLENTPNTAVQTINWLGSKNYPDELAENFMIEMGDLFDLAVNLTNKFMGWSIVARSDEQVEDAQNWIALSRTEGSVPVGSEEQVTVTVNPAADLTEMVTRYARIRIRSNDTYPYGTDSTMRTELNLKNLNSNGDSVNFRTYVRNRQEVLVMMRMNQAPELSMEQREISVGEMQDSTVMIYVLDQEGDRFDDLQVVLDSSAFAEPLYGIVPQTELKKAEVRGDTVCFAFSVKPGYEAEGKHYYRFTVKDAKDNAGELTFVLQVENLNRAPEATGANAIVIRKEITTEVNLSRLFGDPDRQAMTYSVDVLNDDVATANIIDTTMSLIGWQEGEAQMKITAVDPEGAAKTIVYTVTVIAEDPARTSTEVLVFPNPVVDILNCAFALNKRADVLFRIYGSDGKLFYESEKQGYVAGKHKVQIQVGNLPGGIYILQYEADGSVKDSRKFIK